PYLNFSEYVVPSPVNDLGDNISGYNGMSGIAQLDWDRLKEATNYADFEPTEGGGDQFGATVGAISEEMIGLYFEGNVEQEVAGRPLRINAGVRWVATAQEVNTLNGDTSADYRKILPSMNVVYDLSDSVKVRASASRSLTRANPSDMFPNA